MGKPPFEVLHELAGWTLFWARLTDASDLSEEISRDKLVALLAEAPIARLESVAASVSTDGPAKVRSR